MAKSATILWCPSCKENHPCRSIKPGTFGEHENANRWVTDSGIHFFKRLRQCESCAEDFATIEIAEATFQDLERATATVKAIKKAIRTA